MNLNMVLSKIGFTDMIFDYLMTDFTYLVLSSKIVIRCQKKHAVAFLPEKQQSAQYKH